MRCGQPSDRSRRKKAAAAGAAAACAAAKRVSASASASGWTLLRTAWWVEWVEWVGGMGGWNGWVNDGWVGRPRHETIGGKTVGWMGRWTCHG